jgi:hypothetical protein
MSQYAIVHLRHGDVEAVFYAPDLETAFSDGLRYAIRSDFFGELDDEFAVTVANEIRRHRALDALFPRDDKLVIKRVFGIGTPAIRGVVS